MKNFVFNTALLFAVLIANNAMSQQKANKKNQGDPSARMVATLMKGLEPAELTAEQKKEIEELYTKAAKEVAAKRKEAEMPANLTKKRADAAKEAKESGLKGKKLQAAIDEKLGLTKEQAACWTSTTEMLAKAKLSVGKLLTAEQIAKVKAPLKNALTGKSGGKKKQGADA